LNIIIQDINNDELIKNKNYLNENINTFKNSNILHEINQIEKQQNTEYNDLLDELKLLDDYNYQLENLNNYKYNLEINNQIEENNILIDIYYENQIINETIYNINNNNLYNDRYDQLLELIDDLNKQINDKKMHHKDNEYNYNKLLDKQFKYEEINNKLIELNKGNIIFSNIVSLTNIDGIPKKIINNKLTDVEKEVNNIIFPFINKKIYITGEAQ